MKKINLFLLALLLTALAGCGGYSKGDSVVALPAYSDIRPGHIEGIVLGSEDGKVTINITKSDIKNSKYREGSMAIFEEDDVFNPTDGLALVAKRKAFFDKMGDYQSLGPYTDSIDKEYIAKLLTLADEAELKDWVLVFTMHKEWFNLSIVDDLNAIEGLSDEARAEKLEEAVDSTLESMENYPDLSYKLAKQLYEYGYQNGAEILFGLNNLNRLKIKNVSTMKLAILRNSDRLLDLTEYIAPLDCADPERWKSRYDAIYKTQEAMLNAVSKAAVEAGKMTEEKAKNTIADTIKEAKTENVYARKVKDLLPAHIRQMPPEELTKPIAEVMEALRKPLGKCEVNEKAVELVANKVRIENNLIGSEWDVTYTDMGYYNIRKREGHFRWKIERNANYPTKLTVTWINKDNPDDDTSTATMEVEDYNDISKRSTVNLYIKKDMFGALRYDDDTFSLAANFARYPKISAKRISHAEAVSKEEDVSANQEPENQSSTKDVDQQ